MFNKLITLLLPFMPKKLVWIFSRKYIAGETIDDAVKISKELNAQGIRITIDLLGEFIKNLDEAEANKAEYLKIIERVESEKINGNYSLKPTSFGLLLDQEVCYRNIREIVAKAASYNNFVRIDMEDSPCTDLEIELYRGSRRNFRDNVGLVVQAYLKRTRSDLENLMRSAFRRKPAELTASAKGSMWNRKPSPTRSTRRSTMHFLDDLEFLFKQRHFSGHRHTRQTAGRGRLQADRKIQGAEAHV